MAQWVNSDLHGDLQAVPGLGPAAVAKLAALEDEPITNTWMLIGKYLMLKGPDVAGPDGSAQSVSVAEHHGTRATGKDPASLCYLSFRRASLVDDDR